MTRATDRQSLPPWLRSLAIEHGPAAPGSLFVLADGAGVIAAPQPGAQLTFGRNAAEVDVCVGGDDERISRRHGLLEHTAEGWTLCNIGRLPIQLPGSRLLFARSEPFGLPEGYTPVFILGRQEHVVELRVVGATAAPATGKQDRPTAASGNWRISEEEKVVLVALGQRYLRHEDHPQPLSWRQVSDELGEIRPEEGWTPKRAEHTVVAVRKRLSAAGTPGLTRDEVGDPVGNALNHNLLLALLSAAALVPPDLELLGGEEDDW